MKIFIISAILFALLLTAITLNAYAVKRISANIIELIELIESENFSQSSVGELEIYWKEHQIFIGFSASRTEIEYISRTIVSLHSACGSKALSDAKLYLDLLRSSVSDIARHENISFENLF